MGKFLLRIDLMACGTSLSLESLGDGNQVLIKYCNSFTINIYTVLLVEYLEFYVYNYILFSIKFIILIKYA